ncbi:MULTISPECIES: hypothetical protein [Agrobacterium]|uniref:hypothetical protein n=1 Tax=Agrobacterium TaxID=357 RepID=UPI00131491BC|nr:MULTISPECIES: hypothetical protein [Agrobacterium]
MKPEYLINRRDQFLVACHADTFIPQPMTFNELEDEFPPFPWPYCVITNRGDR